MAAALAQLHEATFEAPGPYDPRLGRFVAADDYHDWTIGRIESLREQCRTIGALSKHDERYIDALVEQCAGALAEPFLPVHTATPIIENARAAAS